MAARVELLAVAVAAAQAGGGVLRRLFGSLRADQIAEKGRNDWVTAADRASEEVILHMLRHHSPEVGILAEESGEHGSAGRRWVVDPLDGTANFLNGFPHFAVSVALVEDGNPVVGVIHDPLRDELFTAVRGQGAWRNGHPIAASVRPGLAGSFLATGFPFRVHPVIDVYLRIFKAAFLRAGAIRRPGAATLDLAHTAAGIFDGFFEFSLSPWDLAAGVLLVREAGGTATDLSGGPDVFARGHIVAGSSGVHGELLAIIQAELQGGELHVPVG